MAKTRAQENRAIRQDALREQLSGQKHIEKVIENIKEIETLASSFSGGDGKDKEIDYKEFQAAQFKVNALKTANDQRLKLVGKYLPDLKQQEITIEADIVAKDRTRKELEAKLSEAGIDWASLDG